MPEVVPETESERKREKSLEPRLEHRFVRLRYTIPKDRKAPGVFMQTLRRWPSQCFQKLEKDRKSHTGCTFSLWQPLVKREERGYPVCRPLNSRFVSNFNRNFARSLGTFYGNYPKTIHIYFSRGIVSCVIKTENLLRVRDFQFYSSYIHDHLKE